LGQIFELHGGLGNQLFQLSAARRIVPNPIFDVAMLREPFLKHVDSSAVPLITEEKIDSFEKLGEKLWHIREKALSGAHAVFRRERIGTSLRIKGEGYRESLVNDIRQSSGPLRIRGYFQSLKFLDFVPQGQGCKRLVIPGRNESLNHEMQGRAWSSIHIRLGDFRSTKSVLSLGYYQNAIELLMEHGAPKNFVLFSDEPSSAMKLIEETASARWVNVIPAPEKLSALETLRLMSEASSSIVANSTLSWWGAATNPDAALVVAPRLWGVSMTEPVDLIPSHWKTLENW
jgi:hypothetical protein